MHLSPRRTFVHVSILTLLASATASAQLTLDELYTRPSLIGTAPTEPAWSPDGSKLAFLWNAAGYDIRDLWLVDLESETVAPFPVTTSEEVGVAGFTWHPDGETLVFERGGELFRLPLGEFPELVTEGTDAELSPDGRRLAFLRDGDLFILDGANERRLVGDERAEVYVESYRFSPDGSRIAFVQADERRVPVRGIPSYLGPELEIIPIRRPFPGEEPRSTRLGVVPVSGDGTVRSLDLRAPDTDPIFSYRWSSRGQLLVDRSDLYVKSRRILAIDPRSGRSTVWVREDDEANVTAYWQAEWAPDGGGVYFLSDRDDDYHIYHVSGPEAPPKRITSGEFAVARFTVTDDAIFFVANAPNPEERHLFRVGLDGGQAERWTERRGTHDPVVAPNGSRAADLFSSDVMPPELFLVSTEGETRMTQSPLPAFYEREWVTPRYVTFESHVDGATLHGRLMLPQNFDEEREYPVIMGSVYANTVRNQWGGRNAHPLWGLDQYLLHLGYIVFTVDVRGSWGHGREFRRDIRLDYGGIDVEDLESGVRYLETLDYADASRIGIWGSSYGGLLTTMSLFKKPGIYAAGVAGAPATNVFHALTGEMRVMMSPQDEPEHYEAASAYTHAAGLRDPLLIIHGMQDRIVLYRDTLALVEKLMELGKNVDLVTLPDSGHAWDREELYQTRFAFRKLVEYFERHVKNKVGD